MIEKIKDKLPYILSLLVIFGVLFWAFGCRPETQSLVDPARKVSRPELIGEIDYLMAKYKIAINDLDKQEEFRDIILQQTFKVAQTGTVNPLGIIASIMAIMGLGAGADNVRLRKQRKNDYANNKSGKSHKLRNDSSPSEQSNNC